MVIEEDMATADMAEDLTILADIMDPLENKLLRNYVRLL